MLLRARWAQRSQHAALQQHAASASTQADLRPLPYRPVESAPHIVGAVGKHRSRGEQPRALHPPRGYRDSGVAQEQDQIPGDEEYVQGAGPRRGIVLARGAGRGRAAGSGGAPGKWQATYSSQASRTASCAGAWPAAALSCNPTLQGLHALPQLARPLRSQQAHLGSTLRGCTAQFHHGISVVLVGDSSTL